MRRALGTSVLLLAPLPLLLGLASCRTRGEDRATPAEAGAVGPTMPTGMLAPAPSVGAGAGAGVDAGAMKVSRGIKSGAWTELQVAAPGDVADRRTFDHWREDSRFVSLEGMMKLHEAFARALPGFDLFLPRLFGPDALAKLATELDALAIRSAGPVAELVREVAAIAREHGRNGKSLWVLGP